VSELLEKLYPALLTKALLDVIKNIIKHVSEYGTGGDPLYITFNPYGPGTILPNYLQEQYPDGMTIVLQHQYENLEVNDGSFSVTLSFNGMSTRVCVPWINIMVFLDEKLGFGINMSDYDENFFRQPKKAPIPEGENIILFPDGGKDGDPRSKS
jgi:hypothetical protein